jgi:hypothetical protein
MNGFFGDGIDGVSTQPFKLCAKLHRDVNPLYYSYLDENSPAQLNANPHSKFALAYLLCDAQRMGRSLKKTPLCGRWQSHHN